ncbi:MAG: hypothetical protein CM15mP103_13030 [Gammaproteobacteria bacterium]|nr:MAG: hypothetical protein CM15mP103_13030 [Gammaproteobacteria bacterium]
MQSALSVYMGSEAAKTIGEQGWQAAPFSTLIGASGGPKWLILSELDKVLGQALLLKRGEPMTLLGSSIGTWRHACLSINDPGAAISRLQHAYLYQEYSCARPSPIEVSEVAEQMLREALGPEGARQISNHPTLHNAIVTARAKGVARGESGWKLGVGMATATLGNAISRKGLGLLFDRVAFCHGELNALPFADGFNTQLTAINELNLIPALKASGAIPFLMQCEPSHPRRLRRAFLGRGHH